MTIFTKTSVIDASQGPIYVSEVLDSGNNFPDMKMYYEYDSRKLKTSDSMRTQGPIGRTQDSGNYENPET